jgi:ABC-type cobalamin/Fe3+-siderophores transport system ATPase subunit
MTASESFSLTAPRPNGDTLDVSVNAGEMLFILGANGSGKSSLMHRFYAAYKETARRMSAHRQTWFPSGANSLSAQARRDATTNIRNTDVQERARWTDDYAPQRPAVAVYDLVDAENVRARSITAAVDERNIELAKTLSQKDAPIKTINKLLRLSHIPIKIAVQPNAEVVASKSGSKPYNIDQLSDGERNALLVAAEVLTVSPGTLILIDEPERHLHRAIISPLLSLLFAERPDCAFVISTHEVMLPLDNSGARTLLVRGCNYKEGGSVESWDANIVPPGADIGDDLKKDILGARRKLLFVEGADLSLDKPLYSLVFPEISIIAKSGYREVSRAVCGIRDASDLHWVRPFGIVDNDGRTEIEIEELKKKAIYALSVFSVESIYYHPEIQQRIAEQQASVTGKIESECIENAKNAALAAVEKHVQRLSERVVEKTLREEIRQKLPGHAEIATGAPITISIDVAAKVGAEKAMLENALKNSDLEGIIMRYPVRETPALTEIAKELGFQSREQYEAAVRKLLIDDNDTLKLVRSFFGPLPIDIAAT